MNIDPERERKRRETFYLVNFKNLRKILKYLKNIFYFPVYVVSTIEKQKKIPKNGLKKYPEKNSSYLCFLCIIYLSALKTG